MEGLAGPKLSSAEAASRMASASSAKALHLPRGQISNRSIAPMITTSRSRAASFRRPGGMRIRPWVSRRDSWAREASTRDSARAFLENAGRESTCFSRESQVSRGYPAIASSKKVSTKESPDSSIRRRKDGGIATRPCRSIRQSKLPANMFPSFPQIDPLFHIEDETASIHGP